MSKPGKFPEKPTTTKCPELPADFYRVRAIDKFRVWAWVDDQWRMITSMNTHGDAYRRATSLPYKHWFVTQCAEEIVDSSDREQSK